MLAILAVGLAALATWGPGRVLADEPAPGGPPAGTLPGGMITVPAPTGPGGPATVAIPPGPDGVETVAAVPGPPGLEPVSAVPRLDGEFPGPAPSFQWYFRTEAIALRREVRGDTPFVSLLVPIDPTLASSPTNWTSTTVLSEDDLQQQFRGGPRFTIGHRLGDSPLGIEFSYFWLAASDAVASVFDAKGHLFSPFAGFGNEVIESNSATLPYANPNYPNSDTNVDQNTLVQVHETLRLNNGEANLRWNVPNPCGCGCVSAVFLVGARYMNVREQFDYLSLSSINLTLVSVDAHTNNESVGRPARRHRPDRPLSEPVG